MVSGIISWPFPPAMIDGGLYVLDRLNVYPQAAGPFLPDSLSAFPLAGGVPAGQGSGGCGPPPIVLVVLEFE